MLNITIESNEISPVKLEKLIAFLRIKDREYEVNSIGIDFEAEFSDLDFLNRLLNK